MRPAAAVRRGLHLTQAVLPRSRSGTVVLAYHLAGGLTSSPVDLPAPLLRAQLEELRAGARVLSLDAAVEQIGRGDDSPSVVLTFDDAYASFHEVVLPMLRELGLPAVLYVPVDFIDGRGPPPIRGTSAPPCSWSQLREIVASGLVTIGSHTMTHRDLRTLSSAELEGELTGSREALEDRLGVAVTSFCYPRGDWSPALEPSVAGEYRTAVIGGGRRNHARAFSPLRLQRVPVRRDMPSSVLPVVESRVWLEEWLACRARAWVH